MGSNLDPAYEEALKNWVRYGKEAVISKEIRDEIHKEFYQWLLTSVIRRAIQDLRKGVVTLKNQRSAYRFLKSKVCKIFCMDLGLQYSKLESKIEGLWQSLK